MTPVVQSTIKLIAGLLCLSTLSGCPIGSNVVVRGERNCQIVGDNGVCNDEQMMRDEIAKAENIRKMGEGLKETEKELDAIEKRNQELINNIPKRIAEGVKQLSE